MRAPRPALREPICPKRCYGCHGATQQMSNLQLDDRQSAIRVIKPVDSAASRLHGMIASTAKLWMPPAGEGVISSARLSS